MVAVSEPLVRLLGQRIGRPGTDPAPLLEVLTRRYYGNKGLSDVRSRDVAGCTFVTAEHVATNARWHAERGDRRVEGNDLAVHIDQLSEIFEMPVVLTVEFAERSKTNLVIPISDRSLDRRFPLSAAVRSVEINKEDGGLADFVN